MARQGTTPIVVCQVAQEFDGSNVYVTIDQNGTQVTKASRTSEAVEVKKHYDGNGNFAYSTVAVYLTQPETLGFDVGVARVQIRWVDYTGDAFATNISQFRITESLLQEVIQYGN